MAATGPLAAARKLAAFGSTLCIALLLPQQPGNAEGNPSLTASQAKEQLAKNTRYFNANCGGKRARSLECHNANSAIIYTQLQGKNYKAALTQLTSVPLYNQNSFTACADFFWTPNKKLYKKAHMFSMWAVLSVANSKLGITKEYQRIQYINGYLCEALLSSVSNGAPPIEDFPMEAADFVRLAPRYVSAKSADAMNRFEQEIAAPYRKAWLDIITSNPSPKGSFNRRTSRDVKVLALQMELMKNAKSASKARGFPERYTNFFDPLISEARHRVQLAESVKN